MAPYTRTKWFIIISAFGTSVGGLVLLKDYVGGKAHAGKETLIGKTAVITGANTGIGRETARDLAKRGARVIMACRDLERCEEARKDIVLSTGNANVICKLCDLASFKSVRSFADKIKMEERQINLLINNAGVMRCPRTITKDGFEMQFGVNHLGHFLLTNLLLDKLKASVPSRIINVSSVAHVRGSINFDDLNGMELYDDAKAYNQSKLANVLFSHKLSKILKGTGVTVYTVHPGIVNTEIGRHMGIENSTTAKAFVKPLLWLFTKTPKEGAQTTIYCAVKEELGQESGKYYSNSAEQEPSPEALDEAAADRLWAISESWTRLRS